MREYGGGIWLLMARSEWEIDGTKCERKRKEKKEIGETMTVMRVRCRRG